MLNCFFAVVSIFFFLSSERRHLTSAKWNEGRMGERWELWVEKNCWKHCLSCRPRWTSDKFPEILFKLLSLKRWMLCWSSTVQPKTSTTESSTAVSCCSLEIWSGQSSKFILLKIFLPPRLFACYNDGVINLLEKYFDMQKKGARDALGIVAFIYIFCIALLRYNCQS